MKPTFSWLVTSLVALTLAACGGSAPSTSSSTQVSSPKPTPTSVPSSYNAADPRTWSEAEVKKQTVSTTSDMPHGFTKLPTKVRIAQQEQVATVKAGVVCASATAKPDAAVQDNCVDHSDLALNTDYRASEDAASGTKTYVIFSQEAQERIRNGGLNLNINLDIRDLSEYFHNRNNTFFFKGDISESTTTGHLSDAQLKAQKWNITLTDNAMAAAIDSGAVSSLASAPPAEPTSETISSNAPSADAGQVPAQDIVQDPTSSSAQAPTLRSEQESKQEAKQEAKQESGQKSAQDSAATAAGSSTELASVPTDPARASVDFSGLLTTNAGAQGTSLESRTEASTEASTDANAEASTSPVSSLAAATPARPSPLRINIVTEELVGTGQNQKLVPNIFKNADFFLMKGARVGFINQQYSGKITVNPEARLYLLFAKNTGQETEEKFSFGAIENAGAVMFKLYNDATLREYVVTATKGALTQIYGAAVLRVTDKFVLDGSLIYTPDQNTRYYANSELKEPQLYLLVIDASQAAKKGNFQAVDNPTFRVLPSSGGKVSFPQNTDSVNGHEVNWYVSSEGKIYLNLLLQRADNKPVGSYNVIHTSVSSLAAFNGIEESRLADQVNFIGAVVQAADAQLGTVEDPVANAVFVNSDSPAALQIASSRLTLDNPTTPDYAQLVLQTAGSVYPDLQLANVESFLAQADKLSHYAATLSDKPTWAFRSYAGYDFAANQWQNPTTLVHGNQLRHDFNAGVLAGKSGVRLGASLAHHRASWAESADAHQPANVQANPQNPPTNAPASPLGAAADADAKNLAEANQAGFTAQLYAGYQLKQTKLGLTASWSSDQADLVRNVLDAKTIQAQAKQEIFALAVTGQQELATFKLAASTGRLWLNLGATGLAHKQAGISETSRDNSANRFLRLSTQAHSEYSYALSAGLAYQHDFSWVQAHAELNATYQSYQPKIQAKLALLADSEYDGAYQGALASLRGKSLNSASAFASPWLVRGQAGISARLSSQVSLALDAKFSLTRNWQALGAAATLVVDF